MQTIDYSKYSDKATILSKLQQHISRTGDLWLPDIAISRDPGSGGRVIAQMVAKKLKWKLLDREFMVQLAKELSLPESEFAALDEHPRGWWVDVVQSLFNPDYVSDVRYLAHLCKLIYHASKDQQTVILGRGAEFVLPSSKCLRVRITAPLSVRIANTMKYEGKTRVEADAWVRSVQDKRDRFIRQYFGRTARWISNYDIAINVEHFSLPAVRDMIIEAYFVKFPEVRKQK